MRMSREQIDGWSCVQGGFLPRATWTVFVQSVVVNHEIRLGRKAWVVRWKGAYERRDFRERFWKGAYDWREFREFVMVIRIEALSKGIKQHNNSSFKISMEEERKKTITPPNQRLTKRKKHGSFKNMKKEKERTMAAVLLQRSSKRNFCFKASKKLIIRSKASKKVITQSQASKKARRMKTLQQNQKSWRNQDLKKARNKKIEETKINRLGGNMLEDYNPIIFVYYSQTLV
ncbi:hypothetical protein Tco_0429638 [Tanacetum coccineum]